MEFYSILVADENKEFCANLAHSLRSHNWLVDCADNGYKAIELLQHTFYDVILLDIKLSGMRGVETVNEIKKIQPGTIVFLMASGTNTDPRELPNEDIYAVIQKPLDIQNTVSMIAGVEKKGVVLVVDDNEADRSLLSEILTKKGYHVVTAKKGAEAVDHVKKREFDVVLLDMQLPDMHGSEVLEEIKEHRPALSIIAITGQSLDDIIETIVKKGAYTCFLKPFDAEMLLHEISVVVHKRDDEKYLKNLQASKILLVEDNDNIRETTDLILSSEGYQVKTAASLAEATVLIEKESFDVVISDLSLGTGSGLSLVDPVRRKDSSTVFLLMTGRASMETALEAIKKDVDEYILKPVEPQELIHKVKMYIEKQSIKKEKEALLRQLKETNMKLLELIKTDELTGVFNRRYLFEQLHQEMQRARRQKSMTNLLMCDVDGFKKYNDAHGHVDGDELLKRIAQLLKSGVRQYVDHVYRYGGDEFAIIVPAIAQEDAKTVADRVVQYVSESLRESNIGISIGLAHFDGSQKNMSLNDLVHAADTKLYEAKRRGGRQVVL